MGFNETLKALSVNLRGSNRACNRVLLLGNLFFFLIFRHLSHYHLDFDHFLIHCSKLIIDSTSSCPFAVSLYSTRGGISLQACLSNIPPFSNSFNLRASVLLLNPLSNCLNSLCLTGVVEQHSGINISIVPLLVINFLTFAVSFIKVDASYPSKLHSFLSIGSRFTSCPFVSNLSPALLQSP